MFVRCFLKYRDKNRGTSRRGGCDTTAVNKRRVGKIIHFPADIKTCHSNSNVNTEGKIGQEQSCAVCTVVEANIKKEKINIGREGNRWEEVVDGNEKKRLKAWRMRSGDDREGMVSEKTRS